MLAGSVVARTPHFAWHCAAIDTLSSSADPATRRSPSDQLLFVTRDVWLGAMVPKRWAKRAVTRNAIKRQIYSMSSDFESVLATAAHVVRLRAGFNRAQFASASSEVLKAAVRLELQQLFARAAMTPPATNSRAGGA